MPNRCCIPNCGSNHKSSLKSGAGSVSIFKFPKEDDPMFHKWTHAISGSHPNWNPSRSSAVCVKHFRDEDVEKTVIILDENQIRKEVLKERPKLKLNAIPTIFPDCSNYHNMQEPNYRPGLKTHHEKEEQKNLLEDRWTDEDSIGNLSQFRGKLGKFYSEFKEKWELKECNHKVVFYKLNFSTDVPHIEASVTVRENFFTQVCIGPHLLLKSEISWLLNDNCILERWSQLRNILNFD